MQPKNYRFKQQSHQFEGITNPNMSLKHNSTDGNNIFTDEPIVHLSSYYNANCLINLAQHLMKPVSLFGIHMHISFGNYYKLSINCTFFKHTHLST